MIGGGRAAPLAEAGVAWGVEAPEKLENKEIIEWYMIIYYL